jgi:hypothetical protein
MCACIIIDLFLENIKRILWEPTRLLERNVVTISPSSFKAEDNIGEKRNKRWHVKYALKYCVTPEKLHTKMSDIEHKESNAQNE